MDRQKSPTRTTKEGNRVHGRLLKRPGGIDKTTVDRPENVRNIMAAAVCRPTCVSRLERGRRGGKSRRRRKDACAVLLNDWRFDGGRFFLRKRLWHERRSMMTTE